MSKVIVKDGVSSVDSTPFVRGARSSGGIEEDGLLIISPPKLSIDCEKAVAEGQPFSEQFRKAVF